MPSGGDDTCRIFQLAFRLDRLAKPRPPAPSPGQCASLQVRLDLLGIRIVLIGLEAELGPRPLIRSACGNAGGRHEGLTLSTALVRRGGLGGCCAAAGGAAGLGFGATGRFRLCGRRGGCRRHGSRLLIAQAIRAHAVASAAVEIAVWPIVQC